MQVSVRLAALPIPEYLDFHSGYSAPRSRIAEYILIPEYSQTNAPVNFFLYETDNISFSFSDVRYSVFKPSGPSGWSLSQFP